MNRLSLAVAMLLALSAGCQWFEEEPPTYTVVRGDTLTRIAKAHDCSVDELRQWNGIKGDLIEVGQVLPGPWWARIDYLASEDGELIVRAGATIRRVEVERGLHQLLMLTEGDFDSVSLRSEGSLTVCVDNVHVGPVVPVGAEEVAP